MVVFEVQSRALTTECIQGAWRLPSSANLWQWVWVTHSRLWLKNHSDYSLLMLVSRGSVLCEGCPDRLFLVWWVFTCLERWSLLMNLLPHCWHPKRFSPVCVRRCRCSSSERVKLLPQKSQLQMKGLSPACQRKWAFRCEVFLYTLPHSGMWQMCSLFFPNSNPPPFAWQLGHLQRRQRRVELSRPLEVPWRRAAIWGWCPKTSCRPREKGWLEGVALVWGRLHHCCPSSTWPPDKWCLADEFGRKLGKFCPTLLCWG